MEPGLCTKTLKMDDILSQLEAEYCPPLDPALLSAILSDYELGDQNGLAIARETLDELKESALLEEQADFDPSGTGARKEELGPPRQSESSPDTSATLSHETDATSVSNGLASLDLENGNRSDEEPTVNVHESGELENLDNDTKIQLLQDVFGEHISRFSIEFTLKKCNGRWHSAMEELLNQVYFSEASADGRDNIVRSKGIDGFSDEALPRRGRRSKAKKKRLRNGESKQTESLPTSSHGSPEPVNRWKSASEDINFISERTGIAKSAVSSVYYEKSASVPQTIGALLKATMDESKLVVTDDAAVAAQARELGRDFPGLAPEYLLTIIRLTFPFTTSAHELARALTQKPKVEGGIQIIPQHVPLTGIDPTGDWSTVSKRARASTTPGSPSLDIPQAGGGADYASARATAFEQARAAHRKAKSNHLMGGAAAYYGQVGREYSALSASASAAAADRLAASQSNRTQLDLHGIDVLNGVRIARERVEEWWDGLGESRVNGRVGAEDRQTGYRIVVGLGRHSEGGKGKLGPAVSKMLRQEGWKMEATGAVIVVKGPAR